MRIAPLTGNADQRDGGIGLDVPGAGSGSCPWTGERLFRHECILAAVHRPQGASPGTGAGNQTPYHPPIAARIRAAAAPRRPRIRRRLPNHFPGAFSRQDHAVIDSAPRSRSARRRLPNCQEGGSSSAAPGQPAPGITEITYWRPAFACSSIVPRRCPSDRNSRRRRRGSPLHRAARAKRRLSGSGTESHAGDQRERKQPEGGRPRRGAEHAGKGRDGSWRSLVH